MYFAAYCYSSIRSFILLRTYSLFSFICKLYTSKMSSLIFYSFPVYLLSSSSKMFLRLLKSIEFDPYTYFPPSSVTLNSA